MRVPAGRQTSSRREFLKHTGRIAAATTLVGAIAPRVHAAENNTIQVALVGCGGRGTGAASNALAVNNGPIKLVAMADVFENRLKGSREQIKQGFADKMDVPADRQFVGFDAYKKAMDCLKPGDVVILTTPPAFRWVHFTYAIQKGLNVFMEKPVTVDGPTTRKMIKLADESVAKNLKVGVGLMSRHARPLQELAKRIQGGELGDVVLMRGYRMHGPVGFFNSLAKPADISEVMYQIQRFHSFLWASGGCFSDFYIHIIDHCCWLKGAWPVKAQAVGGRHYRQTPEGQPCVDQNFDVYAVEYTFDDNSKFLLEGRCMTGCENIYSSYIHGTKGSAIASKNGDCGGPSSIYKAQAPKHSDMLWESKNDPSDRGPYQNEWDELIEAIRNDKPYNEVKRGAEASLVTSMGRMAAHTGREITFEGILNSQHEFAPALDKITADGPAPVTPVDGKYPVPMPGIVTDREY